MLYGFLSVGQQREIVSRQYLRDYSAKIWEGRVFIACLGVTLSEQRLNSATPAAKKLGSKRGKEHGMEITREKHLLEPEFTLSWQTQCSCKL